MSVKADAETLRSIPIFAGCDPVHLQLLAFSSERQKFNPGEVLTPQGQTARCAFLILSGQAVLLIERNTGEEIIGSAGPGALLGEVAMIGAVPYSVTSRATEPVSTARISRSLFLRVAEEYPEFGRAVFKSLAGKLDSSMSDLKTAQVIMDRAKSFSGL